MKALVAAALLLTGSLWTTASRAELFFVSVDGRIDGVRYTVPCDPFVDGCFVIEPFSGAVRSFVFSIDLQPGPNVFDEGNFYGSGSFSGTIVNDNRVLTGLNLTYGRRSCGPGVPSIGCEEVHGTAARFNVSGGVPEPGTWSLLVGGFAVVGAARRRRRHRDRSARPSPAVGAAAPLR